MERSQTGLIRLLGMEPGPEAPEEQAQRLLLRTDLGEIQCLYHPVASPEAAVLWVWGIYGGFAGPAEGIYGVLARALAQDGIGSLRLSYRQPRVFEECVPDVVAGARALAEMGYRRLALVGHSLGGAVVIAAAPLSPNVVAVVGLSNQTYGAQGVARVSPRPLLLVHGTADRNLPSICSETIYAWAKEPKELVLYEGAGHGLRQCKEELQELLKRWLKKKLGAPLQ